MSAPLIVRSLAARRDLDLIGGWIVRDSGLARAESVIDRIERSFERLALFPTMGRVRLEFEGAPRLHAVPPWLVVYQPLPDRGGIHILRVIDGRRDLVAVLGRGEG